MRIIATFVLLLILPLTLVCRDSRIRAYTDTVTVIPGEKFQAGSLRRLIFGNTWRDLWATPIKVPVIDLKKYAGGLVPEERGGGLQTQSLKFRGADGRRYKFRGLMKSTERFLPEELHNTLVEDVVAEIFSTTNPMSAIIATPIINSMGILQAQPELVVLPDSDLLGEFRELFGGMLGTLEIHPDELDDESKSFAGADKVFGTYKLFNRMKDDNDWQVDSKEFLKARLIDLYIGDWDRHFDQWRWASYEQGKYIYCRPVPRDRDQVFCRYDGFVPWAITEAVTHIESCEEVYPQISDLIFQGRYLDRKYLASVDKRTWDSVTNSIMSRLTDSLIDYSISLLPEEIFSLEGNKMRRVMLSRRERLPAASETYYKELARYVEIWCSDKDEVVEIQRTDSADIVSVFKRDDDTGDKKPEAFFRRAFYTAETKEVRIFLFDDDDLVRISGTSESGIDFHIVGGDGKDEFIDESEIRSPALGFLPIAVTKKRNFFYDDGGKTKLKAGVSSYLDQTEYGLPKNDTLLFEQPVQDWGYDWRPALWFDFNSDEGLFIGGGPELIKHGFRYDPYEYSLLLRGGYSSALNGYKAEFRSIFPIQYSLNQWEFDLYASSIDVIHFYGYGNDTKVRDDVDDNEFYRSYTSFYRADLSYKAAFNEDFSISLGLGARQVNIINRPNTFIFENMPENSGEMLLMNYGLRIKADLRNNEYFPEEGFYIDLQAGQFHSFGSGLSDYAGAFEKVSGDIRAYLEIDWPAKTIFAFRIGGRKLWGSFPFYEAAFLGDFNTIRGYGKQRFSGDASIFGNLELRMKIGGYKFIVPGDYGILALADGGRVYLDGNSQSGLHYSWGGGIWVTAVYPDILASLYFAKSPEKFSFYYSAGFMF